MEIKPKTNCPLHSFEPCKQLECAWFMKITGKDPQKNTDIEDWGCAVAWLPVLLIENARVNYQTGAAVESFRNEMVKSNESTQQVLMTVSSNRNLEAKIIGETK